MVASFPGVYKHVKTGGLYVVIGSCRIEKDNVLAIRYRPLNATYPEWIRPEKEFFDGRFKYINVEYLLNEYEKNLENG